jgi:hypothetical protein
MVGDHLLLRDFGPYGDLIFMDMRVVTTVAMVTLLRDFGPCGIIFMTVYVTYIVCLVILDG